jgi:hypothetical protein
VKLRCTLERLVTGVLLSKAVVAPTGHTRRTVPAAPHGQRATLVTSARFAEIVTFVLFDGGRFVETMNVLLVAPAGTVMLLKTEAILAELLERVTLRPPVGAGPPLSVTVPVDVLPPFTLVGWRVSESNVTGGFTVSVAGRVSTPRSRGISATATPGATGWPVSSRPVTRRFPRTSTTCPSTSSSSTSPTATWWMWPP